MGLRALNRGRAVPMPNGGVIALNDPSQPRDLRPSVSGPFVKDTLPNVKKGTAKDENIFECLKFNYSVHGRSWLERPNKWNCNRLKSVEGPKTTSHITTKGKGSRKPRKISIIHAPGKFNRETGWPFNPKSLNNNPSKLSRCILGIRPCGNWPKKK